MSSLAAAALLAVVGTAQAAVPINVNFQPSGTTVPAGYVADTGQQYSAARGYGWVRQSTLNSTHAGITLAGRMRDRNLVTDQRLDTFAQTQSIPGHSAEIAAAWELAVPDGNYTVTIAVGDAGYFDSVHRVSIEGTVAIAGFIPSSATRFQTATRTVGVTDGRLSISPEGGTNTKFDYVTVTPAAGSPPPSVTAVTPGAGETNVCRDAGVTVQLSDGVDPTTATAAAVKVLTPGGGQVSGFYNTDGAYSNVTFVPSATLQANTVYTVQTTSVLKDPTGRSYTPFSSTFTTRSTTCQTQADVAFNTSTFDYSDGTSATSTAYSTAAPSALALGPDPDNPTQLWVGTGTGDILVYNLSASTGKAVGNPTKVGAFSFSRVIAGMKFDPSSTAGNIKLWVSNGQFGCDLAALGIACTDMTGALSTLTGSSPGALTKKDIVTGLPRSVGNHMNNGFDFGPDGAIYLAQGAQNGYGLPDAIWGNRAEVPLAAAILRIDIAGIGSATPYSVNTANGYNPNAAGAKVKTYATGTRNPFSVIWHSNGKLYAPVNESANGNTPADPAGGAPALSNLPAFDDYFTRILPGKFYGHPNPTRGEYRLNGANPTAGTDPFEVPQYPVGTLPNANWRKPDMDLGVHRSADGTTEFKSDVFGTKLKGQILFTEYSGGKDVVAVKLDANGTPASRSVVVNGLYNPLPIVSDPESGRVYVGEYGRDPDGKGGKLTMLAPVTAAAAASGYHINFQASDSVAPGGYTGDTGLTFTTARGRGWENASTGDPMSIAGNGRERHVQADKRLDTFMQMQAGTPARWELVVPNGTYDLTIAVGDPSYTDSHHVVNAEGVKVIDFTPTDGERNSTVTKTVTVDDGRLTLTPTNGTNTKIDYIDLIPQD